MLLHVVITSKLLLAAFEGAWHGFLCSVDLGVSRRVTRSGKGLVAAQRFSIATIEPLRASLGCISVAVVVQIFFVGLCLGAFLVWGSC
jgi:hypothetical protein